MGVKRIYVAATSQHIGKTTSTLGLIAALKERGVNVGYCKPVGQESVGWKTGEVDKDAVLFADFMKFDLHPDIHSPVILGKGATAAYIDNPEKYDYVGQLEKAAETLNEQYDTIVYEGTGHPGVGSVVDLSNARVAKMLDAGVIMVVKGGIGNTLDRLHLSLSVFRELDVPVLGVIVNKVLPRKLEKVRKYVGKKLEELDLKLLGLLPYDKSLANPLMTTIVRAVKGYTEMNEDYLDKKVESILAGSLIDIDELKNSQNLLLIVSITRLDDAIKKITSISERQGIKDSPLSGIIVTSKGNVGPDCCDYIKKHKIPLVRTDLDTYGSAVKISRIEVKINTRTPWKVQTAVNLIKEHVDLGAILD